MIAPSLTLEREALATGAVRVAGIDEVGRGALAGPVTVGVVVVDISTAEPPLGLRDSKLLTPLARERLAPQIHSWSLAAAIGSASSLEIDRRGIIGALRLATHRALGAISKVLYRESFPDLILLDGNHDWLSGPPRIPKVMLQIKGDQHCASIAAASVIAKQHRDLHMARLAPKYPQYAFAQNKGYGSPDHMAALTQYGPARCHRQSWKLPRIGDESHGNAETSPSIAGASPDIAELPVKRAIVLEK